MSTLSTKRYFKFLCYPDYFGDPNEDDLSIPISRKGGIVEDPRKAMFYKIGEDGDRSGIYFTDIENALYYRTHGDYYVEIFPIPGIPVKPCKDEDGRGYYTTKVRYGPVKTNSLKFTCWLIENGADISKINYSIVSVAQHILVMHMDNKWTRKLFQLIMVRLSNMNLELYGKAWNDAHSTLGDQIYSDLYEMLKDDQFDIFANGLSDVSLCEILKNRYREGGYVDYLGECIHMYLVRMRTESPAAYAMISHFFPEFESYIESAIDPEGFTFLKPKYHGSYDDFLAKKREKK